MGQTHAQHGGKVFQQGLIIILNKIHIFQDGLCKYVNYQLIYLEIPQTPLPENIKSFNTIKIRLFSIIPNPQK